MKNIEKLFLHLYAYGIEYYGDSRGALKAIHNILKTPEDHLWENMHEAIEQAKRKAIFKKHGVKLEIHDPISQDVPKTILDELAKESISLDDMKKIIINQMREL